MKPSAATLAVIEADRDHRAMLAQAVAALEPGQTVRATFAPLYRGRYTVTATLEEPDGEPGVLTLGGWERVRLSTGLPPVYLVDLALDVAPFVVTEPGVFHDMPEGLYHSGPTPTPSLSYSGAKVLLQGPPARFRYQQDHRPRKTAWDFGHAWHSLILGKGDPVVEVEAKDWRTKAAQEARANAYDRGFVPLLSHDVETVKRMAEVFRQHPDVAPLLADGVAEVSMFGRDPVTGCWIRGRADWVTPDGTFVDVKTTTDASDDGFNKTVERFGYAIQAAWYEDLSAQLDDIPTAERFVFAAQEKEAPYLVHVFELNAEWLAIGRHLYRQALDLFAQCVEADQWPGYRGITTLAPPRWMLARYSDAIAAAGASVEDVEDVEDVTAEPVPLSPAFEAMLARMAGLEPAGAQDAQDAQDARQGVAEPGPKPAPAATKPVSRGPGRPPLPDELLRAVAADYVTHGGRVAAVAKVYGRPPSTVSGWVRRARARGFLPTTDTDRSTK